MRHLNLGAGVRRKQKIKFSWAVVVHCFNALILGRQGQVDLCECKVSLVYRASARTGSKATHRNPVLKNINK